MHHFHQHTAPFRATSLEWMSDNSSSRGSFITNHHHLPNPPTTKLGLNLVIEILACKMQEKSCRKKPCHKIQSGLWKMLGREEKKPPSYYSPSPRSTLHGLSWNWKSGREHTGENREGEFLGRVIYYTENWSSLPRPHFDVERSTNFTTNISWLMLLRMEMQRK